MANSLPQSIIDHNVNRIVIGSKNVTITLKPTADSSPSAIEIPWSLPNRRERPRIDQAYDDTAHAPNPQLVQAIVRAQIWLRSLSDGTYDSVEDLARAAGLHPKVIRNRIRMAFLAPNVTKSILEGNQAPGLRLKGFIGTASLSWFHQRRLAMKAG
jgi:site-specific DNA recombinase